MRFLLGSTPIEIVPRLLYPDEVNIGLEDGLKLVTAPREQKVFLPDRSARFLRKRKPRKRKRLFNHPSPHPRFSMKFTPDVQYQVIPQALKKILRRWICHQQLLGFGVEDCYGVLPENNDDILN
jgi:hypothetical protein